MSVDNGTLRKLIGLPTPEVERRINAKLQWCEDVVSRCYGQIPPRPTIVYDLKGRTAGQAWGVEKIRLNIDLLYDERYTDNMVDDTLVHEYAHIACNFIYQERDAHGPRWQSMMITLGLSPTRCHNYEVKAARRRTIQRHGYECNCINDRGDGCMVSTTVHNRIQNGTHGYSCAKCGKRLTPDRYLGCKTFSR